MVHHWVFNGLHEHGIFVLFVLNHLSHLVLVSKSKVTIEVSWNVVGISVRIGNTDWTDTGFTWVFSHVRNQALTIKVFCLAHGTVKRASVDNLFHLGLRNYLLIDRSVSLSYTSLADCQMLFVLQNRHHCSAISLQLILLKLQLKWSVNLRVCADNSQLANATLLALFE